MGVYVHILIVKRLNIYIDGALRVQAVHYRNGILCVCSDENTFYVYIKS